VQGDRQCGVVHEQRGVWCSVLSSTQCQYSAVHHRVYVCYCFRQSDRHGASTDANHSSAHSCSLCSTLATDTQMTSAARAAMLGHRAPCIIMKVCNGHVPQSSHFALACSRSTKREAKLGTSMQGASSRLHSGVLLQRNQA
jgi:hypothetical protein